MRDLQQQLQQSTGEKKSVQEQGVSEFVMTAGAAIEMLKLLGISVALCVTRVAWQHLSPDSACFAYDL